MKKTLTLLFILSTTVSLAQQDPYYTHFKDVIPSYNPAAAGEHWGKICLTGLSHFQWRDYNDETLIRGTGGVVGELVEDVAPVTYNLNVGTLFRLDKEEEDKFLGVGLAVISDQIGFTASTSFMGDINYKQQFQGGHHEIAVGVGLGGLQFGFVNPKFRYRDPLDPNIPVQGGNQMAFDMNAGLMYKNKRLGSIQDFYAGISATHLNRPNYVITTTAGIIPRQYVPHYYLNLGGDIPVGSLVLEPAVLGKYSLVGGSYKPQFDLNMTALYASKFRGGLAYRQWGNADAISVLLGFVKNNNFTIGYSYDITVSKIQSVSAGTHEIMVKYCIPFGFEPPPPGIKKRSVRLL